MAKPYLVSRVERLQKELKEAKAAITKEDRKERNGQLIAFGVLLEQIYKTATPEQQESLKKEAADLLDDRNRDRAMKGFDRLDATELKVIKEDSHGTE